MTCTWVTWIIMIYHSTMPNMKDNVSISSISFRRCPIQIWRKKCIWRKKTLEVQIEFKHSGSASFYSSNASNWPQGSYNNIIIYDRCYAWNSKDIRVAVVWTNWNARSQTHVYLWETHPTILSKLILKER